MIKRRELRISQNLILEILRGLNSDRKLRVEGIPDDAQVVDAKLRGIGSLNASGRLETTSATITERHIYTCELVLTVETEEGEDGEPIDVTVTEGGR